MILELLYLATASAFFGTIFTIILLLVCWALNVDLSTNSWVLGIPALVAVALNIFLIEMYHKHKKRKEWGK